jgi:hypothetical protein
MGACCFVIYGALIRAYPIVAMNSIIIAINIYYLIQMSNRKEYLSLLDVNSTSAYLRYFLDYYRDDIRTLMPEYRFEPDDEQLIIFVLRDLIPGGLFIGKRDDDGVFQIFLDYVRPSFRDFKIGKHLYFQSDFFRQHDIRKLISTPNSETHEKYLRHMGFEQGVNAAGELVYYLDLPQQ